MHNWAPFNLVELKVYVDKEIFFYFSFVFAICLSKMNTRDVTHDLFTDKVLSRWNKFNSRDPFTYYDWTLTPLHICNYKLGAYFQTPRRARSFSALSAVYVKGSRELKLFQRESTFSANRLCKTWHVFKTKLN